MSNHNLHLYQSVIYHILLNDVHLKLRKNSDTFKKKSWNICLHGWCTFSEEKVNEIKVIAVAVRDDSDNWLTHLVLGLHDDVIKWKHFLRYWAFVRGIHRSPVNSPHKGQWRGTLMFSLICVWINVWVNNREAGDLRLYHAHYDVIVM